MRDELPAVVSPYFIPQSFILHPFPSSFPRCDCSLAGGLVYLPVPRLLLAWIPYWRGPAGEEGF
jgi:hypothetical protein